MTQHALGEIGRAYAENHKQLETARATYELERDRLLKQLAATALELTGRDPTRENAEYVTNYLSDTRWGKTRDVLKKASQAGFTVAIGALPWFGNDGSIAFAAYWFFQMGGPALARIQGAPLGRELGIEVGGRPAFGRIKSRVIAITDVDFRLDVFRQELARLHEQFEETDARVTSVYRKALGLGA